MLGVSASFPVGQHCLLLGTWKQVHICRALRVRPFVKRFSCVFRSHLFCVSDLAKRVNVSSSDLLFSLLDSFFFFFQYSWFFFEVLIKSMAQHLIENSKVKVCHFLSRFTWQFSVGGHLFHCSQHLLKLSGYQSRYCSRGFLSSKAF